MALPSRLEAVGSLRISSVSGLKRIFRPSSIVIWPRWPGVAERLLDKTQVDFIQVRIRDMYAAPRMAADMPTTQSMCWRISSAWAREKQAFRTTQRTVPRSSRNSSASW